MPGTNSGTDQTSIQYVRPGTWQASAGIAGIDEHHTYVNEYVSDPFGPPLGNPRGGPAPADGPTAEIPTVGPSAGGMHAPPQNDYAYWQNRNASAQYFDDIGNGADWNTTLDEPQPDTLRPLDPRRYPIPTNRITQTMSPMNLAYLNRNPTSVDMRHAKRFNPNPGTNFAFTPSLRPSPMSLGDGNGVQRFRTTQRVSPAPLDQTIHSEDQSDTRTGSVLSVGGQLTQKWW